MPVQRDKVEGGKTAGKEAEAQKDGHVDLRHFSYRFNNKSD